MHMHRKALLLVGCLSLLLIAGQVNAALDAGLPQTDAKVTVPAKVDTTPTAQPADPTMPTDVPKDGSAALDKGKEVVELAKAKRWFAMSAGVIWLLLFLLKVGRKTLDFLKGMHRRWLYVIVCVLSIAAMVLAKLQGDLSWGAAVNVLLSGPAAAYLNDLFKRGIFGKEPTPNGGGG